MRKAYFIPLLFLLSIILIGCENNPYPGIPEDARLLDEGYGVKLFLTIDDTSSYPYKTTVWAFDTTKSEARRIVSSCGDKIAVWVKSDSVKSIWPKDSISAISDAHILIREDNSLCIVVEGCPDHRNLWTYIVAENLDSAILLPSNAGYLGLGSAEYSIITQSYGYYGQGGSYNIIKAFDLNGDLINEMAINQQVDIPFDLYMALEDNEWKGVTTKDLAILIKQNPNASTEELIMIAKEKYKILPNNE